MLAPAKKVEKNKPPTTIPAKAQSKPTKPSPKKAEKPVTKKDAKKTVANKPADKKKVDKNSKAQKKSAPVKKPPATVGSKRPAPTKVTKLEKKVVQKKKTVAPVNKKPKRK